MPLFDLVAMGRSGLDLYAEQVGAPFEEVRSFAEYVGGSPANIAVGARRLGLRCALVTAVSEDPVGDFILRFLEREDVDTRFVARKPGTRSGAVLLAMQPPDRFPLVHYREDCADQHLDIDDVLAVPFAETRTFLFVGTSLSRSPGREATLFAAEQARAAGAEVVMDLDLRVDQWHDPRAYGVAIRSALRHVDVVVGTQDEVAAAASTWAARAEGDLGEAVATLLAAGPGLVVEKRGAAGARLHAPGADPVDVPGFPVEVQNTLGAGDAFAAGFLCGRLRGWGACRSARLGNACGALVVTRHGCSAATPTYDEAAAFADAHGGL